MKKRKIFLNRFDINRTDKRFSNDFFAKIDCIYLLFN
jgi:hypothetical protein